MRLNLLLFAIVALITSINASAIQSSALKQDSLSSVRKMGTTRSLRIEKETKEERAVSDFLTKIKNLVKSKKVPKVVPTNVDPKLTKVASIKVPTELSTVATMPTQSSSVQSKLNKLVKSNANTEQAFSTLKLGSPTTKLFDADALPLFVRFLEKSSVPGAKNIYKNGVETLLTHFPEKRLITIVNSGLKSKSELSFATADRLRAGLVSKWWSEGKDARGITLLLKNGEKVLSKSNKELVAKYTLAYNRAYITKLP
ncbi:hypothetical protein DVH05_021479 [Phytophthora capsici]|nr:hypothetical protein DVH05_021479 [Phytophthora capsici]